MPAVRRGQAVARRAFTSPGRPRPACKGARLWDVGVRERTVAYGRRISADHHARRRSDEEAPGAGRPCSAGVFGRVAARPAGGSRQGATRRGPCRTRRCCRPSAPGTGSCPPSRRCARARSPPVPERQREAACRITRGRLGHLPVVPPARDGVRRTRARAGERLRLGCVACRELYERGTLGRARPDAWRRAAILVRGGLGLSVMRLRRWLQGALLSPRRGQTGSTVRGSWSRVVGCQPTESAGGSRRDASSTTSSNARTHIPTRATRSNAQVERLSAFASARVGLRSARGELKIPVSGVRSPPWPLGLSPPKIMS